jgi:hypothetical protein
MRWSQVSVRSGWVSFSRTVKRSRVSKEAQMADIFNQGIYPAVVVDPR